MQSKNTEAGNLICVERCLSNNRKTLTQRSASFKWIGHVNYVTVIFVYRAFLSSLGQRAPPADTKGRRYTEHLSFCGPWSLLGN